MISFPLYHGTSSHYLDAFRVGRAPAGWPYKESAIGLLRETWKALRSHGIEPEWWVNRALAQESKHANWQHGELYVTPSKCAAVRYAGAAGPFGGELMMFCDAALDRLEQVDPGNAAELRGRSSLSHLLDGNGLPILVEIGNVFPSDLSSENAARNVTEDLSTLEKQTDELRELIGQQINFRLARNCGVVSTVSSVDIQEPDSPTSKYCIVRIGE
jgi:hypothetical protein